MNIEHVILHEVVKEQMSDGDLNCRDNELPIVDETGASTPVVSLVEQILELYDKRMGKGLGIFESNTTNYPFSRMLGEFYAACSSPDEESGINCSEEFVRFTTHSMENLLGRMNDQQFSTGGYVLFVLYRNDDGNPLMCVAMLRNKQGNAIDENLNVKETIHIDLEKLHICCQIDITPWLDQDDNESKYMSFIKGRASSTTPEYFIKFVGCAEFSDSSTQTAELVQVVRDYCRSQNLTHDQSIEFRRRVYDYCKDKLDRRERVFIPDLSRYLDEDNPEGFLQFVNDGTYDVGTGFEVHPTSLKKLQRVTGGNNEIRLAFNAYLYGTQIRKLRDGQRIVAQGNAVVIHDIPSNLLKALEELDTAQQ